MLGMTSPGGIRGEEKRVSCSQHPFWLLNLPGELFDTMFQAFEMVLLC